jgi:hypothetical protein
LDPFDGGMLMDQFWWGSNQVIGVFDLDPLDNGSRPLIELPPASIRGE